MVTRLTVGKALEGLTGQVGMTHRYVIQIDAGDYDLGSWTKAGGLGVSWDRHTYRPGNSTAEVVQPGAVTYTNIVLSRAAGHKSQVVKDWLASVRLDRKTLSGAIYLVDFLGMPSVTWQLSEFFPISWRLSDFESSGARPAIETLELTHAGFLQAETKGGTR